MKMWVFFIRLLLIKNICLILLLLIFFVFLVKFGDLNELKKMMFVFFCELYVVLCNVIY